MGPSPLGGELGPRASGFPGFRYTQAPIQGSTWSPHSMRAFGVCPAWRVRLICSISCLCVPVSKLSNGFALLQPPIIELYLSLGPAALLPVVGKPAAPNFTESPGTAFQLRFAFRSDWLPLLSRKIGVSKLRQGPLYAQGTHSLSHLRHKC